MCMLTTEWISAHKEAHLHKSPRTTGLLMHKISKSQPFSAFEYLSENETLFLLRNRFLSPLYRLHCYLVAIKKNFYYSDNKAKSQIFPPTLLTGSDLGTIWAVTSTAHTAQGQSNEAISYLKV